MPHKLHRFVYALILRIPDMTYDKHVQANWYAAASPALPESAIAYYWPTGYSTACTIVQAVV